MTYRSLVLVACPHCQGSGMEPGIPFDELYGTALCGVCGGNGEITKDMAAAYARKLK